MAEQMSMGEDFANNRQLELAVGNPRARIDPLADIEQLRARQRRREMLEMGQADFMETEEEEADD